MIVKLSLTTLLLVALVQGQAPNLPIGQNVLPNQGNLQNTLPNQGNLQNTLPNQGNLQNTLPSQGNLQNSLPNQQYGQQMGMLPNNQNQMQNQLPPNGQMQDLQPMNFLQSLREIPARGLQMLNNVISNVRNMIPGMGRNNNQMFQQQNGRLPFNQMNNQITPANLQGQNGLQMNLPEPLGSLTRPVTNSLSQGRLPNPSDLTQSLSNSLGQLTQGLNGNAANGQQSMPAGFIPG